MPHAVVCRFCASPELLRRAVSGGPFVIRNTDGTLIVMRHRLIQISRHSKSLVGACMRCTMSFYAVLTMNAQSLTKLHQLRTVMSGKCCCWSVHVRLVVETSYWRVIRSERDVCPARIDFSGFVFHDSSFCSVCFPSSCWGGCSSGVYRVYVNGL